MRRSGRRRYVQGMETNDWVTATIAAGALVVSVLGWLSNRRGIKAAEKAADAGHEQLQILLQDRKEVAQRQSLTPWSLIQVSGKRYVVRHDGPDAYEVDISGGFMVNVDEGVDLGGPVRDGMEFGIAVHGAWQKPADSVRFRWRESPGGEQMEQSIAI